MGKIKNHKVWLLFIRFLFTVLALIGQPFLSYLETGRPMMEWSLIIGILVTLIIIYVNGDGYFYKKGQHLITENKKRFYHSISFWTAFVYTVVALYLTIKIYGNLLH
jgi:hypothetical protein